MSTDNKNITIRPAANTDLPKLAEFLQTLVDAERPFDPTLKEGEIFYYDIQELISDKATEILVVESNNEIIGSGYAQIRSAKPYEKHEVFGYLGFMFVSPEFRGQGISGLLLTALKKWILSQGITEVRLQVYDENESAVKAYEKAGFKKIVTTMRCDIG
ncbi:MULTISPECIES: GNAT family N-acetyltransferase [unclassified Flavobacterium]|jgi:ribosomal protein S18 acetylase RimI-like enzyme|uniref:GNAT family N-acetyltransferase n=1 Tax=unclassified Flavobacterium TaxID=196869 RepID=UPI0012AA08F6|nr:MULTISPECIES: GNAT family N-acetyltransferase [unclassified Flavobacterium]MBF4485608.1 GNAT family N-acetyltransferase [Flavobacterium sp. CSZ]QGK77015.1 GNAT family N-acetyltransferase [Flavobacterium sp. SLB02]